jgi:hypothetical protein
MLLPRSLEIEIGRRTWPSNRPPAAFLSAASQEVVDVATVLNLIGVLTTPPLSGGASLSELWAFVRYFFAVTGDDDLRLTQDFLDMDPHQKTILSDDFGMGFTMHWIASKLDLLAACDGRYFIENHLNQVGAVYSGGTGKRGLGKSPDFIAIDSLGKFHVIECKGTQSSLNYRNQQLRDSGSIQKRTVRFPRSSAGERLCAGIFIAGPSGDASSMRIIDPEPPEEYAVSETGIEAGHSAVAQGFLAKQLRSAGFARASAAVAFPTARREIEGLQVREERSDEWLRRIETGEQELASIEGRVFTAEGESFVGRRAVIQLPRPLETKRGVYMAAEVRRGIHRASFEHVRRRPRDRPYLDPKESREFVGSFRSGERQGRSWIMMGESYYSDIRLLRDFS